MYDVRGRHDVILLIAQDSCGSLSRFKSLDAELVTTQNKVLGHRRGDRPFSHLTIAKGLLLGSTFHFFLTDQASWTIPIPSEHGKESASSVGQEHMHCREYFTETLVLPEVPSDNT
eukprot:4350860-Ditylum_brightwellii.AAC.1